MPAKPTDDFDDFSSYAPRPDVVVVIDRAALIENIINQIIIDFCTPRKDAWQFIWTVMLDTSVMPLGSKIKVVMAVAHDMKFNLEKNSLHRLIALRNAFAHHSSDAHPVFVMGKTPQEDTSYLQFLILESSGKISQSKRHEAFDEFNTVYQKSRDSLSQLKSLVNKKYVRGDS